MKAKKIKKSAKDIFWEQLNIDKTRERDDLIEKIEGKGKKTDES